MNSKGRIDEMCEIRWNECGVEFDLSEGSYAVSLRGVELLGCVPAVIARGGERFSGFDWRVSEESSDSFAMEATSDFGVLILRFSSIRNSRGVEGVGIEFEISSSDQLEIAALRPLTLSEMPSDHLVVGGRRMGGCSMLRTDGGDAEFSSVYQLVSTIGGVCVQFAHPLRAVNQSEFAGRVSNGRVVDFRVSTEFSSTSARLAAEPLSIFVSEDGHSLMRAYGEAERSPGGKTAKLAPGWNSWDYYRWTITEEEVLKNAEFIKNDPVLSEHVRRITIDDGWQYCYGEWDANPLFPSGMEALAAKIADMGFEPGLWIAPTIVEPHARIAQVGSDMLAKGISGLPCLGYSCMERKGFLLDPTRDDVKEWLFDLFTRYVGYGYKFFKLDFLAQTLNAIKFHDPTVGRGEIMREILKPIREATLGKALLLGCNYTFEAGDDLVDTVRVSGDIHADWNCIKHNSPSIAVRFWTQDVFWDNDPDFALARGPETSNDPDLHSLKPCLVFVAPDTPAERAANSLNSFDTATAAELETLLGLVVVSGGCVNLSDNIPRLNERGLDMARRTVAAERGEAGTPLDLFASEYPGVWTQKIDGGHRILLINWDDAARELVFDAASHGVRDEVMRNFWNDETFSLDNGIVKVELPPHSSLFLELLC